ncbi:MAG TPA: nodulation protein NfeD [Candidatus Dormibacteraeota bacterium]|nr:nodulation protein NfeD [Candidatus Dormibacteraeota bacterium]
MSDTGRVGGTRLSAVRRGAALTAAVVFAAILFALGTTRAQGQGSAPASGVSTNAAQVVEIRIGDEIEPVLAEYVDNGIAEAERIHAHLILITMDTPGGLSTSMEDIIRHILDSPVPVAIYVSPTGSRGASAGFFILLSADVAAMAPGTHTGAASPLLAIGGIPLQVDKTLKNKILNDATAFLRSYAAKRGRNVELAETAVTDGKAWTETEALNGKLIDLIANSPEDLLTKLNGRTIKRFDGSTTQLSLDHPVLVPFSMSFRERFLSRIVQPDAFFILLIVGVLGLYAEFTHPGMIAPGVIGGISLVLALYAMHILPVAPTGVVLIFLALGLFILEAQYTSHGVLAFGGIISMLLGAMMLIRSPLTHAGVSLGVALGATLPFALITIMLMRLVLKSRAWKQSTGLEQLVNASAEVTVPLERQAEGEEFQGMVRMHGELWRAVAREAIPAGAHVRVTRITGLTLHVSPVEHRGAGR